MEQNKKIAVAIILGLGLAVFGCVGLGLIVTGLSYFGEHAGEVTPVGGPIALLGDAGPEAESDAPSEAEFARQLQAALADAGHDDLVYRPDDSTMASDAGTTLSLTNIYAEYQRTPAGERDAFVERTVRALFPAPIPESWEVAKAFLMPSVRDTVYLDLLDVRTPDNHILRKPVAPELSAALVYDGEASMQFVTSDHLKDWGVTVEAAWAAALENLEQREGPRFEKVRDGVYRSPWKDNYDTARVLMPKRIKRLRVKGDPVVFLPHRDVMIVTGSADDDGLLAAVDAVEDAMELPRSTTGRAWRLKGETWSAFLPASGVSRVRSDGGPRRGRAGDGRERPEAGARREVRGRGEGPVRRHPVPRGEQEDRGALHLLRADEDRRLAAAEGGLGGVHRFSIARRISSWSAWRRGATSRSCLGARCSRRRCRGPSGSAYAGSRRRSRRRRCRPTCRRRLEGGLSARDPEPAVDAASGVADGSIAVASRVDGTGVFPGRARRPQPHGPTLR